MPKRLILLRHAKSAWDNPSLADFDRPLSSRGRKAAPVVGAYLARRSLVPDLVLTSSAKRTLETLDLVCAGWQVKPTVRKLKSLYLATPREMLRRIQAVGREPDCVMLVGHNPGIADFANWLCSHGKAEHRANLARKFPTGAVAVIEFDVEDWGDADAETGHLIDFATPKQIERGD
ncbi:SixA phosphatase family protein [Dongia deserti]|uniref:SixA phosphatase family protein n=1 Tax=Dongia deserti TaxID=2268030 RepID=UPI0013C52B1E|nr:histidine phosphatase family protein [Dongia deserti]